ncbi:hypothetical protein O6H91_Y057800 [Diphasiastrum complanatum]|nr:hypothetical protein O6H91_Y057800 [Diphasiastrum complanatum]
MIRRKRPVACSPHCSKMRFFRFRVSVVTFVSIFMIAPLISLVGRINSINSKNKMIAVAGSEKSRHQASNINYVLKVTELEQTDSPVQKEEWEELAMKEQLIALSKKQRSSTLEDEDKKAIGLEGGIPVVDMLSATGRPSLSNVAPVKVGSRLPTIERGDRLLKELEDNRGNWKADDQITSEWSTDVQRFSTPQNHNSGRRGGKAPDFLVRLMQDQITMARVYLSIAQGRSNRSLLRRDLKMQIREIQHVLGESKFDDALPRSALEKIRGMAEVLVRAQEQHDDSMLLVRKLRAMLQSTEDYTRMLKKQTGYLSQLATETVPKNLNCLALRLSVHYSTLPMNQREFPKSEKLEDPSLYHYALFSDNVLAASVVVNSTIVNAREPEKHVFHLVTDKLNFWAMKMWFLMNHPGMATIHIECIDSFEWLQSSYCAFINQPGQKTKKVNNFDGCHSSSLTSASSNGRYKNPKYTSILNNLRFYLPQLYPKLGKILFLDDDVVVQQDLTPLWSIVLRGKVNAAVEMCHSRFHRFNKYLDFSHEQIARNFDPDACVWAYGMNLFDLEAWRREGLTGIFHKWLGLNQNKALWKLGSLPPALITFYGNTLGLEQKWHQPGLGYNPNIEPERIENAAVIHYSGNLKPWLDNGLVTYKPYWARYVKYDHPFLQECNINQ